MSLVSADVASASALLKSMFPGKIYAMMEFPNLFNGETLAGEFGKGTNIASCPGLANSITFPSTVDWVGAELYPTAKSLGGGAGGGNCSYDGCPTFSIPQYLSLEVARMLPSQKIFLALPGFNSSNNAVPTDTTLTNYSAALGALDGMIASYGQRIAALLVFHWQDAPFYGGNGDQVGIGGQSLFTPQVTTDLSPLYLSQSNFANQSLGQPLDFSTWNWTNDLGTSIKYNFLSSDGYAMPYSSSTSVLNPRYSGGNSTIVGAFSLPAVSTPLHTIAILGQVKKDPYTNVSCPSNGVVVKLEWVSPTQGTIPLLEETILPTDDWKNIVAVLPAAVASSPNLQLVVNDIGNSSCDRTLFQNFRAVTL
jgi:hypothetical protein